MRQVSSVSLGSSKADRAVEMAFAGVPFRVERVGTDGSVPRAIELIAERAGKVDAIGLGGTDRYLYAGGRRYELRDAARMARAAGTTPVVGGEGIKRFLEPVFLRRLVEEGVLEVAGKRILLMSAVDRPGMAATFPALGGKVVYGDLLYAVGVPIAITSLRQIAIAAALFLPILRRLPTSVLYPTGKDQESTTPKYIEHFQRADVIAGDFKLIRRYMPDDLKSKVVVTNTTRKGDVEELRKRGVKRLITMTPTIGGESFGANVMESVLVTLSGRRPEDLTEADYLRWSEQMSWRPGITDL
ncbi:MAG: quinate 5-dehydrogenase [Armatimonadota bacterium]